MIFFTGRKAKTQSVPYKMAGVIKNEDFDLFLKG